MMGKDEIKNSIDNQILSSALFIIDELEALMKDLTSQHDLWIRISPINTRAKIIKNLLLGDV